MPLRSFHPGNGEERAYPLDLTGFTDKWGWRRVTMDGGNATLDLTETGAHTLDAWMREDGLRVDRMLLVTDTNYIPSGLGPAESVFQTITETMPGGLGTTSIAYQYDALHRLTGATYSGAVAASFEYVYDAVGNMIAYTKTVDGQTTSVTRSFDAANRLQASLDATEGTTSYIYDDNGNLTEVYPPGSDGQNPVGVLRYDYDQRNLMVGHETNPDGTAWVLQAAYVYDGANDRLRQVNYTSGTPVTITYSNDVVGLTQVLVADDGTEQVHNLFGLDLISQDSGSEVRTLLVDGLGSVRVEMVAGVVETATTYEPYGEVLQQTGTSGTVYGFTGEQEDGTTGLLYLRARYYSPKLKVFQSRDPWEGSGWRPATLNYYTYVQGNPAKYTDPSGLCAEVGDDACWSVWEAIIRICPNCAQLQRPVLDGYRWLHEENIHYLRRMYDRVRHGWRPLLASDRNEALQLEADRFGVPVEIVAGVLEAEIALDTQLWDRLQTVGSRYLPWFLPVVRPDPGVGIGNIHVSTARDVASYFDDYYPYCPELWLDISRAVSDATIVWRVTNEQYTIRIMAADIRQLADYRFGSNGNPSLTSHTNLDEWTLEDAIAMWHGYRYGVRDVTPGGRGFENIDKFQDRTIPLETLVSTVVQGPGAEESARSAIPIFVKYMGWRTIR